MICCDEVSGVRPTRTYRSTCICKTLLILGMCQTLTLVIFSTYFGGELETKVPWFQSLTHPFFWQPMVRRKSTFLKHGHNAIPSQRVFPLLPNFVGNQMCTVGSGGHNPPKTLVHSWFGQSLDRGVLFWRQTTAFTIVRSLHLLEIGFQILSSGWKNQKCGLLARFLVLVLS